MSAVTTTAPPIGATTGSPTGAARLLALVAVAASLALWLGGCGGRPAQAPSPTSGSASPSASPAASSAGPPAASSSASTGPALVYRAPGNLCTTVDATPLRRQAGAPQPQPVAWTERGPVSTLLMCTVRLGSYGNAGAVVVAAEVFTDRPAQAAYEKLRDQEDTVSPVERVGADAYSYVDSGGRPHVAAYDANMHLIVQYVPTTPLNHPQRLIPALAEVCRNTIAGLYRHSHPASPDQWRRPG